MQKFIIIPNFVLQPLSEFNAQKYNMCPSHLQKARVLPCSVYLGLNTIQLPPFVLRNFRQPGYFSPGPR